MTACAPSARVARMRWRPLARSSSTAEWVRRRSRRKQCASPARSVSIRTKTSPSKNYRHPTGSDHMVIYLPGDQRQPVAEALPSFDELVPREIVAELDKYIVGQAAAKRAVAIALRNRVRRQKLSPEMAEEVLPKNILMIGPTGVGKTEIARRLARLAGCPFVKVEASKYTEVGYVGRDVESMIRDLVETAIDMVREEKLDEVAERA